MFCIIKFIKAGDFQFHIHTNRFFRNYTVNPIIGEFRRQQHNAKWERKGAQKILNATSGAWFAALPLVKAVRCQNLPIIVLMCYSKQQPKQQMSNRSETETKNPSFMWQKRLLRSIVVLDITSVSLEAQWLEHPT